MPPNTVTKTVNYCYISGETCPTGYTLISANNVNGCLTVPKYAQYFGNWNLYFPTSISVNGTCTSTVCMPNAIDFFTSQNIPMMEVSTNFGLWSFVYMNVTNGMS
jgi:hypothetical protein